MRPYIDRKSAMLIFAGMPKGAAPWNVADSIPLFGNAFSDEAGDRLRNRLWATAGAAAPLGGFVLRPEALATPSRNGVLCAYAADAHTFDLTCAPPGVSDGCAPGCKFAGRMAEGARPPMQLAAVLADYVDPTRTRVNTRKYNELVLDFEVWRAALPRTIEAFFYPSTEACAAHDECEPRTRRAHAAFRAAYPHDPPPPLLTIDPMNWAAPFAVAPRTDPPPAAPPAPPAPPHAPISIVNMLNAQFKAGRSAADIRDASEAGVLVRQFDGQSDLDNGRPWVPCLPHDWCAGHEQYWPASVVNPTVRKVYYTDRAGVVLDARRAKLLCACQGDCNSNTVAANEGPGRRGCSATRCCDHPWPMCDPPFLDHGCSYPADELGEALAAQARRFEQSGGTWHNEVVIDNLALQAELPRAILAFFFMSPTSHQVAATMHTNYLAAFNISHDLCPLVELRLDANDPFIAAA